MLIATSSQGGLDDLVSPVFGRAPTFTLVEMEGNEVKKVEVIQNTAAGGFRGVGIQAAQLVVNKGVNVVIAGNIGPNASMVLSQSGVRIVTGVSGIKARDALKSLSQPPKEIPRELGFKPLPSFQPLPETEMDLEFRKRMLELERKMIDEEIKYLEEKLKELKKK